MLSTSCGYRRVQAASGIILADTAVTDYPFSHCYGNAIAFGEELSNRIFDEWWETVPKRKRTRALRRSFYESLDKKF
jgi:hypothetical protein